MGNPNFLMPMLNISHIMILSDFINGLYLPAFKNRINLNCIQ